MYKILLGSAIALLVFSGCTEDKNKNNQIVTKEEVTQETTQKTDENTAIKQTNQVMEDKKAETVKEETPNKAEDNTQDKKELAVVAPTGETLFKTCASCHGEKAQKEALGKSQVIAGWDKDRIIEAINGYKDGTYGGIMKNIMKSQVENKTDEEIDMLATYISTLK